MTSRPLVIKNAPGKFDPQIWKAGTGQDPAAYLVFPGTVNAPGKHTPGNLRHARPYIVNGRKMFVFPTPVEGFRRSGQATLGLRRYIGDNQIDGVTMHYEEGRITLSGLFPGITARDNMVEMLQMLRSHTKERGLVLYTPGVFEREQYVLPENWDFEHTDDDRTHSISYTVTFVRIGEGPKVKDPTGTPAPATPRWKSAPKGKPARYYTIKEGVRTLRGVAKAVYGDADRWRQLVTLNRTQLTSLPGGGPIPKGGFQLPTFRFPIGTQFRY